MDFQMFKKLSSITIEKYDKFVNLIFPDKLWKLIHIDNKVNY